MHVLVVIYIFVLGTAFGSFALAMVHRMHAKKDWVRGRSRCDSCKKNLSAIDLVPVLSWVINRGKCRHCRVKLSWIYPLSELMSGLVFVLSYVYFPFELNNAGVFLFLLWSLSLIIMTALTIYDFYWYILPNKLIYPLIITGVIYRVCAALMLSNNESLLSIVGKLIITLVVGSGLFFMLHMISSGKWIGDGDVRLGVAMGLFLPGPAEAWLAIFIASLIGVIVAIGIMIKNKKTNIKMKLPFGPFLISGLLISYLFSGVIIDWYMNTFIFI